MLSHRNLLSNAQTRAATRWSEADVLIHALPIFHVHGLFVASHCAPLVRRADDLVRKFDPTAVIVRLPRRQYSWACRRSILRLLANVATSSRKRDLRQHAVVCRGIPPLLIETFNEFH